ncbi:MAG: glucokinase, partial [Gaiellales bacterium]
MTAILAGDIGGTHARFARVAPGDGRVELTHEQTYDVPGSASLEALIRAYLADHPGDVAAAAIGIAAPIVGGGARPINHPEWGHVSAERVVSGPGIHAIWRFVVD